jgi:hypothetical protein
MFSNLFLLEEYRNVTSQVKFDVNFGQVNFYKFLQILVFISAKN